MIRKCPHHGLPKGLLVQIFYNGLSAQNRALIDSSANGCLSNMDEDEAYELLETMAINNHQWPTSRLTQRNRAAVHGAGVRDTAVTNLETKMDAILQALGRGNGSVNAI